MRQHRPGIVQNRLTIGSAQRRGSVGFGHVAQPFKDGAHLFIRGPVNSAASVGHDTILCHINTVGPIEIRIKIDTKTASRTPRRAGIALCEAISPDVFEIGDDGLMHLLGEEFDVGRRQELEETALNCHTQSITVSALG
jgi:ferredoxin